MDSSPQQQHASEPSLCLGNCGFFGSAATNGFCSVCYKSHMSKQQAAVTASAPAQAAEPAAAALASPAREEAAAPEATAAPAAPTAEPAAAEQPATEEQPAKPVQANRNRCFCCNKKVGLLGFECRCGYVFCSGHRHAQDHSCDFDYAAMDRAKLAAANPQVAASKVNKL